MATENLSSDQAAALLDILTHANTYQEIRDFRDPHSLQAYGPPFTAEPGKPSTFPALQSLVARFLLPLPGLRDLTDDFWKVQCHTIIEDLEKANLSESYDKAVLGSRKTLATAISALIEYPVRGTFAGFHKLNERRSSYDTSNAEDLSQSFRDFMQEAVYANILDDLVAKTAETDNLEDHEPIVQAVHEYVLVNLASLMHFTLILSPKGQYLLKLMDMANKMVPYMVIRQTLKIGNVASMINAMMRVVLAKMSVASVTNWIGLTDTKDDGMNLMQHIISTVLHWDIRELESRASKFERERAAAGKEQLNALKQYAISKSREDHERLRKDSLEKSKSIVTVILEDAKLSDQLTEVHHSHALEYLGIQLSIRDRKQIIEVLCRSHPDHLTQSVRELVTAYEPVIRNVHNAVDLSETVGDFEHFLRDMLKMAKIHPGKDGKSIVPTVGDFVQLLKKHQKSCHKFIHQCCKNGKELTNWYLDWAHTAASHFQRHDQTGDEEAKSAGDLTEPLNKMFMSLPKEKRDKILPVLNQQSRHLSEIHAASLARLAAVLKSPMSNNPAIAKIFSNHFSRPNSRSSSRQPSPERDPKSEKMSLVESDPGPGAYLTRWQDLLDSTPITPLTANGPVRHANSEGVTDSSSADVDVEQLVEVEEPGRDKMNTVRKAGKPDVKTILDEMLPSFRELLAQRSCSW